MSCKSVTNVNSCHPFLWLFCNNDEHIESMTQYLKILLHTLSCLIPTCEIDAIFPIPQIKRQSLREVLACPRQVTRPAWYHKTKEWTYNGFPVSSGLAHILKHWRIFTSCNQTPQCFFPTELLPSGDLDGSLKQPTMASHFFEAFFFNIGILGHGVHLDMKKIV